MYFNTYHCSKTFCFWRASYCPMPGPLSLLESLQQESTRFFLTQNRIDIYSSWVASFGARPRTLQIDEFQEILIFFNTQNCENALADLQRYLIMPFRSFLRAVGMLLEGIYEALDKLLKASCSPVRPWKAFNEHSEGVRRMPGEALQAVCFG